MTKSIDSTTNEALDAESIVERQRKYIFPCVTNFYTQPMPILRGKGKHVYDASDREYLDFFGGILTVSVGHCNDEVNARVSDQLETLQHVSTLFPNQPMVMLAEKLAALTPGRLEQTFFTNSGTEANETAILLAQLHAGTNEFIALRHGYSGRSTLTMSATGQASWKLGGGQIPGVRHVANAYCYRCPFGLSYPSCDLHCAKDIEQVIQTTTSGRVAGMIAEPIQGVGGFITPPPEYFKVAVDIVRQYGGIFICDEVQSGWGRTGEFWFGIEHWGVEPEVMTLAKGMGNGIPVGATVATAEVAGAIKGNTLSTFGGNPLSMAAASGVIELIERDRLMDNASTVGQHLRARLMELFDKYPLIGDVRGMGLMQAIELVADRKTKEPAAEATAQFLEACRDEGLIVGKGGLYANVVRISPPLNIDSGDVDDAIAMMDRALHRVSA